MMPSKFMKLFRGKASNSKSYVSVFFSPLWYSRQLSKEEARENTSIDHYLEKGWRVGLSPHPLFDSEWYLTKYPDVAEANLNPLIHFIDHGWREGRSPHPLINLRYYATRNPGLVPADKNPLFYFIKKGGRDGLSPHPLFDCAWYLAQYPDVAQSGVNPLSHFLEQGWHEGRSPHPLFDTNYYLQENPDVAGVGRNPLMHFVSSGGREGRRAHPLFDTARYLARYADCDPEEINPLIHFCEYGWRENRSPCALFDVAWYLEMNPDVAEAGLNPVLHYLSVGWRKGLSPSPLFDASWYLQQNSDVAAAGLNPLTHYLKSGWQEGRSPHPLFDTGFYLSRNLDVAQSRLEPLQHFLNSGYREGRCPHPLFDTAYYLYNYSKQLGTDTNPLLHYLLKGAKAGFNPNPLFDTNFYVRNHETLARTGDNPLVHYVKTGAEEGRDPHPLFDGDYYLSVNPDVDERGINPLEHFLLAGRSEGRHPHPPDRNSDVCDVLDIPYEIMKAPKDVEGRDICIFVTFSADGSVYPHVLDYLAAIRSRGWGVVVIVATNGLARPLPPEFYSADGLIVRTNHGWDFAAWATAFTVIPALWTARSILLTNDSVYGPVSDTALDRTFTRVRASKGDVVALTDSYQAWRHYMSYFWVLTRSALSSPVVRGFFASVRSVQDKHEVVKRYELTQFARFSSAGLKVDILFPAVDEPEPKNPTLHGWRDLLDRGFPFVKVQALRDRIDGVDVEDWREALRENPELITNISSHLEANSFLPHPQYTAAFPAPKRRFASPRRLSTFYGATTATRIKEPSDVVLELPFRYKAAKDDLPQTVAAIVHIFYPDLASEIRSSLEKIPVRTDLFISTDNAKKKAKIERAFAGYASGVVTVKVFPNVGRDIAPMIVGFREVFSEYEFFLHIHSKKSPHDELFGNWRQFLLDNLLGSSETIGSILEILKRTDVGIVFSDHFPPVRNLLNWGYNFELTQRLLRRVGVDLSIDVPLEFPSSSFFWGKTDAIKPLLDLGLDWSDFPAENAQVDGTLAHALERSILYVCEQAGFRWTKVSVSKHTPGERRLPTLTPQNLERVLHKTHRSLIENPVRPAAYNRAISEVKPLATRKDCGARPRLNLLLPTLEQEKVFGGIATALRTFHEVGTALGRDFDLRIIVASDKLNLSSTQAHSGYQVLSLGAAYDDFQKTIINAADSDYAGELPVRKKDIFIATAWWTAMWGRQLANAQQRYFGDRLPQIYLVQDFEPGFYSWSSRFGYALSTYLDPKNTIVLINSEELVGFIQSRFAFYEAYVIRYAPNASVRAALTRQARERIILFYGRPSTDRNCFDVIRAALLAWQRANPILSDRWQIISVGEGYNPSLAQGVKNLEIAGKLSLEQYGDVLSRSLVGVSLMISPHPSYPPLEFAQAGLVTITNRYECKNLSLRNDNIRSIFEITPDAVAEAISSAVEEAEKWVGRNREFTQIRALDCDLSEYDPMRFARRLKDILHVS